MVSGIKVLPSEMVKGLSANTIKAKNIIPPFNFNSFIQAFKRRIIISVQKIEMNLNSINENPNSLQQKIPIKYCGNPGIACQNEN